MLSDKGRLGFIRAFYTLYIGHSTCTCMVRGLMVR